MDDFWVGIPGELTLEQLGTLQGAGFAMGSGLRQTAAAYGLPPFQLKTIRTFVPVSANDESEATAAVATALALEPGDLVAYSADVFG